MVGGNSPWGRSQGYSGKASWGNKQNLGLPDSPNQQVEKRSAGGWGGTVPPRVKVGSSSENVKGGGKMESLGGRLPRGGEGQGGEESNIAKRFMENGKELRIGKNGSS